MTINAYSIEIYQFNIPAGTCAYTSFLISGYSNFQLGKAIPYLHLDYIYLTGGFQGNI